jgi:hypothetical protein
VRIGLMCSILAAAVLAATVTSTAGAAACSRATAKAAVAKVKPRIAMLTNAPALVKPADIDTVICFDFTRDGRTDVAVTVASGGTAGDIGWLVLVRTPTAWKVGHEAGGYKLGLFRFGNDVVVSQPVYKNNDPNCCPTGGFDHERWHWNGKKFVLARAWHTKTYKP